MRVCIIYWIYRLGSSRMAGISRTPCRTRTTSMPTEISRYEDQVMPNRKAEQVWGRLIILGILIRQLSLGLFPARLGNDLFHVHRLGRATAQPFFNLPAQLFQPPLVQFLWSE
jgi:hypothetical protein